MQITLILLVTCSFSVAYASDLISDSKWSDYKTEHNKLYKNSDEELQRYTIWKRNLNYVTKHNEQADKGVYTYWLAMNEFADLSITEFAAIYNGYNMTLRAERKHKPKFVFKKRKHVEVADAVDWRDQGYVTEVKNQGQCGSCWAFSSTGSLEGQHFRSTGKLVSLSEQNLVDCSNKYGNQGCNGGLMDQAFAYVKDNGGLDTEESYPYDAKDQSCKFNPDKLGATDAGFVDVKTKDENALKQAVGSLGPVSVAIDASQITFQLYSHGVYHSFWCSSSRLDHGVLVVGYGTDNGKDYWIVKNSWGPKWGQKGYIWMSRNRRNNCGIATAASYPLV